MILTANSGSAARETNGENNEDKININYSWVHWLGYDIGKCVIVPGGEVARRPTK
jgi:hypothetical protein